ncbi:MAG TPA: hypothetical protein VGG27_11000 [Magnetospirillaceae bacterium]|jgi:hypothetical protein
MALPDKPSIIKWDVGLPDQLLQAIGQLSVSTAQLEETLHLIFWRFAGLTHQTGPIVTDNLNPKRLSEDIQHLAKKTNQPKAVCEDLEILFAEFNVLNQTRNQCVHWNWVALDVDGKSVPHELANKYQVNRPRYDRKAKPPKAFTIEEVRTLCDDIAWLQRRLEAHAMTPDELRKTRGEIDADAPPLTRMFADLFFPAPWLDIPDPPAQPQSPVPEAQTQPPRPLRSFRG